MMKYQPGIEYRLKCDCCGKEFIWATKHPKHFAPQYSPDCRRKQKSIALGK